jgi:adenylylsulfate reductase subunit A
MANNDSWRKFKPIVAEAAKKSADKIYNRIMITHLLMDDSKENRVGGQ